MINGLVIKLISANCCVFLCFFLTLDRRPESTASGSLAKVPAAVLDKRPPAGHHVLVLVPSHLKLSLCMLTLERYVLSGQQFKICAS